MGQVVDLLAWKARREAGTTDPVHRLERTVARLEALLSHPSARRLWSSSELAMELRLINREVSAGHFAEAVLRIERLLHHIEQGAATGSTS